MAKCVQCALDKPTSEFRSKTSGPMRGYMFTTCLQCEGENDQELRATDLRQKGYVCTAPFIVKVVPTDSELK